MSRVRRRTRRRCAASLFAVALVLGIVSGAWAYFSSTGTSTAHVSVGTLGAPSISTATPGAGTVALTWSAVTPASGTVTYYVHRDGGTPAGSCPTSTAPTGVTSCTDSGVSPGSHSYTVTAIWHTWTATSTTTNVTLASGALDHFVFAAASSQTDGLAFTGTNTLTAKDVSGNTVTSFDASTNNVTITANSALTGAVSGLDTPPNVLNLAADFSSGVANLTALGMTYTGNTGTGTFTATSATGARTGTSGNVVIGAGALDHFGVAAAGGGSIATQAVGTPFNVRITAQDAGNNTVTGFTGTVDVTSNRTCSSGCTTSTSFTAGVLASKSVTLTQSGTLSTITATDHGATGKTGISNTFTVNAGALAKFAFALASPQTDGLAFTGTNTLTAQDTFGNTIAGFDASANHVTITENSPLNGTESGLHGANVLNQAADFSGGVADLTALGMTYTGNTGTGTFTATSATGAKTGTSGNVVIAIGTLDHFTFATANSQTNGLAFTGTNTLTAKDVGGNTITTFNAATNNVTVTADSPLTGTVSGLDTPPSVLNLAADFSSGVANLTALGMTYTGNAGTGTFTATSATGAKTGTSGSIVINAGALSKFAFALTSPQTTGAAFTGTNTLTAEDASGNTITNFDASSNHVTITVNSPLTGSVTGLHGSNQLNRSSDFTSGVADLTDLGMVYTGNTTTGTFTATTTSGVTGKTGTSGSVTISAPLDHFLVEAAAGGNIGTQTAGVPFSVKITAQDVSNHTVTGFTGTADITSNRTCSAGCATTAAFTAGVLSSQSVTLTQAGALSTITATDHAGTKTGTSSAFTVIPAAATVMRFVNCSIGGATCSGQPIGLGNNSDLTFNLQTQDPFGNPSPPTTTVAITFGNSDPTFSITGGSPATISTSAATSGLVTLHHGTNGGIDTLTATASSGFAAATLTAKK
jgi:hypothetical protein